RREKNPIASYRRLHRQSSNSPMQTTRLKPRTGNLAFTMSVVLALSLVAANFAAAQDKGSVNPEPLPVLENPNAPAIPAKELFGRETAPAPLAARTIGLY